MPQRSPGQRSNALAPRRFRSRAKIATRPPQGRIRIRRAPWNLSGIRPLAALRHSTLHKENHTMKHLMTLTAALAGAFVLAACGGSAEKQGEKMDSAIEETLTGEVDRDDGLLENTGEAIDEVTGNENTDPVDAVGDAVEEATEDAPQ
jgi:hypothetical protein